MKFASSLLSKKLGFAGAIALLIYDLPMTANQKGGALALVAVGYCVAQAIVDAYAAKEPPKPVELTLSIPPTERTDAN